MTRPVEPTPARRFLLALLCVALTPACAAWAATSPAAARAPLTASLSGTVVDENGAIVPGARVTVSNHATGLQRQVLADGEGYFVFPMLPPGVYTTRVTQQGFAPVEVRDVTLGEGEQLALRIQLKVGTVGLYITVEDTVRAHHESSSTGVVFDRKEVERLLLNGRSLQSLFEFVPGAVLTRASFSEQGQFSVNGQRANANYFTVDGASANFGVSAGAAPGQAAGGSLPALTALGSTHALASAEALQEVRVLTSAYAPEFGRMPGAQVSFITRSGTNEFRGAAYEYFRHDALNANDWFAKNRGLKKARLRQNNFGAVLGGPLVRDRLFFFASYEGLRLVHPQAVITEVPATDVRRAAPESLRPYLDAFPLPNGPECPCGFGVFAASYSDAARMGSVGLRLDASAGGKWLLFGRLNLSPSEVAQRGRGFIRGASAQGLNTLSHTSVATRTLTFGATHFASPKVTAEMRANWSVSRGATSFELDDFGGARPLPASLLMPSDVAPGDASFFLSVNGGLNTSLAWGKGADNTQRQFHVPGSVTFVAGDHMVKVGADYRLLLPVYGPPDYTQALTFNGVLGPNLNEAAEGTLASGRAALALVTEETGTRTLSFVNFSAFAQDTWRASPRLTLTYGLRWELNPPPTERRGRHPSFIALNRGVSAPPVLAPPGAALWETTYGNFAPRAGAAYQLSRDRGTLFRGGFGLFYDLGTGPAAQAFGSVFPYVSTRRARSVLLPLQEDLAAPATAPGQPPPPLLDTVYAFDSHLKLPYSLQWGAAVEQPLGREQLFTAAYVGSAGRRLLREVVQPLVPWFREVRHVTNDSRSDYHAMQLQFQRRAARGLQAWASYTWAHATDDASEESALIAPVSVGLKPPRGPSNYDVRHTLAAALTWDLPGVSGGGPLGGLLRGWALDATLKARSATPFSVVYSTALANGDVAELTYPDYVRGVPLYVSDPRAAGGRRVNRAAFLRSFSGRSLGRNSLRGFGFSQVDVSLRRQLNLTERVRLHLRAEVFNLFNRPNFGNPVNDLRSSLFGQSVQTLGGSLGAGGVNGGLSPVYQVGGPRSAQFSLKVQF
ncbi:MAG TPA: TonB-dependent receptor [Pyrinomonadaceae bacterium]|nr:TonB-dependent receptor [Pyrinomonadaceae bacterium]